MPYDPEEDIELAWKELKQTLPPEMTSFARYYETTWIGTASSPPLFDNASRDHHDSSLMLLPRSSNIADGFFCIVFFFLNIYNIELIKVLLANLILDNKNVSDRVR